MAVTVQDIRNNAPEFRDRVAYGDPDLQRVMDIAVRKLSPEAWGNDLDDAIIYFTAHLLAVANPQASQAQKVRAWEDVSATDIGALGVTRWGRMFAQLRTMQLGTRLPVVGANGFFPLCRGRRT